LRLFFVFTFIEPVWAMSAAAFTTITALEVVLFGKAFISLWREVEVTFFNFYVLFWE
tara:strand:- start:2254 stop:2424 length:171 start_codon:yes stop_codon:yes gene_type:complete